VPLQIQRDPSAVTFHRNDGPRRGVRRDLSESAGHAPASARPSGPPVWPYLARSWLVGRAASGRMSDLAVDSCRSAAAAGPQWVQANWGECHLVLERVC